MRDTVFHRPIPPLTESQLFMLARMTVTLRAVLTPGCDCVGIARFGHTAACRIHQQYRDSVAQTICEAKELRLTWDERTIFGHTTREDMDLQADIPVEFAPHNPGWRVLVKLL